MACSLSLPKQRIVQPIGDVLLRSIFKEANFWRTVSPASNRFRSKSISATSMVRIFNFLRAFIPCTSYSTHFKKLFQVNNELWTLEATWLKIFIPTSISFTKNMLIWSLLAINYLFTDKLNFSYYSGSFLLLMTIMKPTMA